MTLSTISCLAAFTLCASLALPSLLTPTQDPQDQGDAAALAQMMQQAAKFTKPGKHHKELERFVGSWTTETQMFMGGQATKATKGEAEFSWLMPGRWLKGSWKGELPMLGPVEGFTLLGYDNFKQSFVSTQVTSMDTAMLHLEGDMDPSGKALLVYGTLDEYLTGEHDKMVKYVWRFVSADKIVAEVHDLPIGEEHTKVIEVTYEREE
jgi:hypothetical protein